MIPSYFKIKIFVHTYNIVDAVHQRIKRNLIILVLLIIEIAEKLFIIDLIFSKSSSVCSSRRSARGDGWWYPWGEIFSWEALTTAQPVQQTAFRYLHLIYFLCSCNKKNVLQTEALIIVRYYDLFLLLTRCITRHEMELEIIFIHRLTNPLPPEFFFFPFFGT